MIKGKVGTKRPSKAYDKKFEGNPDTHQDTTGFSLAEGNPSEIRKNVGDLKNSGSGRVAHTQHSHYNLTQTFEEAARQRAAGEL